LGAIQKIWRLILFDTYGNIALASFLICTISGVILAIPFDIDNPYDSISLLLITNLPALFFRNLHYWSAQFFLVFTLLHFWEYFKPAQAKELSKGVWFRLVVSILITFFVMLTGFILKADADSLQARRILESLMIEIPFVGEFLVGMLFGNQDSFQLIYVHHIATATIFLFIILYEHTSVLWTKLSTLLISLAILTIISFWVHAPLHDNINPVIKGPWYFIGLQEILHWTSRTSLVLIFILLLLVIIYFIRSVNDKSSALIRKIFWLLTLAYLLLTIIGFFFRGENWKWINPITNETSISFPLETGIQMVNGRFSKLSSQEIPIVQGNREACMNCHENVKGFSPSHNPEAIGCTSCHFGNPFTLDANKAHKGMVLIPGNLSNADLSCGTTNCHPDITERVHKSLMTTNSGIVSVDRFVFGEGHSPDILSHIKELGHTAADKHLRDLCANCHLGNEKMETGWVDEKSRGGGCNACHLNYSDEAKQMHISYLTGAKHDSLLPLVHPSLDINVSNDHCFGCHSRSGRISTNYEGWHETLLDEADVENKDGYRVLQDKRVFEFVSADVHHQLGMECIDCHNSYEVMGDGQYYLHEENAVKILCEDCHLIEKHETVSYGEMDAEQKKIFDLRKFKHVDKKMVVGKESQIPLINVFMDNEEAFLITKKKKEIHLLSRPVIHCTKDHGHENISCSACHTAWAPHCIGCHNEFDKNAEGFDLLENKFVTGEWVEFVGKFFADPPTLGFRDGDKKQIEPAVPGMIMTIDKGSFENKPSDESLLFHRLYAPVSPHTTSKQGRNCKSCHNDPLAIGYGRGELVYHIENNTAYWEFTPEFAPRTEDGLPEDAWIGFLAESSLTPSTRSDFRPFTIKEQQRILTVGACFNCHDENSEIMLKSLDQDFELYLDKISSHCILPAYK